MREKAKVIIHKVEPRRRARARPAPTFQLLLHRHAQSVRNRCPKTFAVVGDITNNYYEVPRSLIQILCEKAEIIMVLNVKPR